MQISMSAGYGCLHNKAFRSHQRRCITLAVVTILCCGKLLSWAVVEANCPFVSDYSVCIAVHTQRSSPCTDHYHVLVY